MTRVTEGFFFGRPSIDAHARGARTGVRVDYDLTQRLRDGTTLVADVFRPAAPGRFPAILVRTPYDKLATAVRVGAYGLDPLALVRSGYAVVFQDIRGTFASEGRFRKYVHDAADGSEAVAWVAAQEWCDGAVGMTGASYLGHSSLFAATHRPPALRAIAPINTPAAHYGGAEYHGGAFQLGRTLFGSIGMAYAALLRARQQGHDVAHDLEIVASYARDPESAFRELPLTAIPASSPWLEDYGAWLAHPDPGSWGAATSVREHFEEIDVPALHVGGWNDVHLKGTLESYTSLRDRALGDRARAGQRLIVGPFGHTPPTEVVGDLWFPGATGLDFQAEYVRFFDTHLKNRAGDADPPVRIYVMGANRWREEDAWPLARAVDVRYFLRAGGGLSLGAPGDEAPDVYVFDPADPVPTVGGATLMPGAGSLMGPRDRTRVQRRDDVLTYTSDVLRSPVEVTGPLSARLYVATSATDTDFTVGLVDVHPDGRAIGVADGILRLRYRDGLASARLAEPGRICQIEVDLIATSTVFAAGHRIQVEISSSNFPRFDRNPNHGGAVATATAADFVSATQRVFHDGERASHIVLPVVRE